MSFDDGPGAQAAADSFARLGLSNGVGDSAGTTGLTQLSQAVAQAISFELVLHGYPGHLQQFGCLRLITMCQMLMVPNKGHTANTLKTHSFAYCDPARAVSRCLRERIESGGEHARTWCI
jgi:hypothetical protein